MLLRQAVLDGIRAGTIRIAFRRWRRPTVRTGGTLLTPIGQLEIGAVTPVTVADISEQDARLAGYTERAQLIADLDQRTEGTIYRIELVGLGPDPRHAVRDAIPTDQEVAALLTRLARLDARSPTGAWTATVLDLIAAHPTVRAASLARQIGMEKDAFKGNVRKLKALGLTESLEVGYRLSARGNVVRAAQRPHS